MKNQKLFNKHFDAFVLFPSNNFYEELLAIDIKKGNFGYYKLQFFNSINKNNENCFLILLNNDRLEFAKMFFENIGKKYEQNYFIMKSPILDIRILNKLFNELKNSKEFAYKYIINKDERGLMGLKPTSYQFNKLKLKMIDNILNLEDSEEKSEKLQGLMYY